MYFDQSSFDVRCEWGLTGIEQLGGGAGAGARGDVIIVVDVLSFSTCVDVAVGRGAWIFPYRFKDETAARFTQEHEAELAGSRGSNSTYCLSPRSFQMIEPGVRVVLPSPNGATLTLAAASKARVLCGCLRNATAVAKHASAHGRSFLVVPAGERWPHDQSLRPALEDLLGAGAILSQLPGRRSPEAQAAVSTFEDARALLLTRLMETASGRELTEKGFAGDVECAAAHDVSSAVPRFDGVAYRDASGKLM